MLFVSTKRILHFSWQHFWRNIWLSMATMIIIILTLFSLTTLILINGITEKAISSITQTVDVSLYFNNQINEESVKLLKHELEKINEIKKVEYISPGDALKNFKIKHKNDKNLTKTLNELKENPLGATLIIKADNINDYPVIMDKINKLQATKLAEKINYEDHQLLIKKINNFSTKIRRASLILSIIFIVIALLTVYNTIRMGIYVHRKEITIMRLVGASNWFIRLPFVIEGLFYALFGCLIFWGLIFILLHFISGWINTFLAGINFNINIYLTKNLLNIFGFELIILILINTISAAIAMSKYLRV